MRVGVTGGNGFIGQYLIRDYGQEYDFIIPVRDKRKRSGNRTDGRYVESDFSVESLRCIFKDCNAVIHLAAKRMPKNRDPLKMADYVPNIECAAHVFEACKDLHITNVICASTKSVWGSIGPDKKILLTETDTPYPGDEYGVSKLCVEALADFYNRIYGMNIAIYRMAEVCGMDLTRGMVNPFWAALLNASIEKRPIPIYGKGISGRDLIYVKDVTRALVVGLEKSNKGVFHIGSGHITTNLEIAEAFCKVFHNKSGIELHPEKEEWGQSLCLSVEKARTELGYEAEYQLSGFVRDIKEEYNQRKMQEV